MASKMRCSMLPQMPTVLKRCRHPWLGATFLSATTVRTKVCNSVLVLGLGTGRYATRARRVGKRACRPAKDTRVMKRWTDAAPSVEIAPRECPTPSDACSCEQRPPISRRPRVRLLHTSIFLLISGASSVAIQCVPVAAVRYPPCGA